jgi:hypothetical protein
MRSDEFNESAKGTQHRPSRFELFFYEQVGARYYLRFTRLALVLIVCLTVIPVAAIFTLFLTESRVDMENVNVNIRVSPQAPSNYGGSIIQPAPPAMPTLPKVSKSQRGGGPTRQTPAAPTTNANTPPTPSPTPSPTPPKSPT